MAATGSRGTRRLAVIVLAVVAVIGAIAVAVPFLISSDAVKKQISAQVTHWTGRKFTFTGDAKVRLFPYLTVRLQDVNLANPGGRGSFIAAGTMVGKLEILPLLAGRLEFAEFRLASPTITLAVNAKGRPNWILDQGVVGTLASKGDSELPPDDLSPPTPRADVSLGRFIIRGGTVTYADARNGMREVFSDVNVDLNWKSTVEAASGRGRFVWRDQPVSFSGEVNAPLTLMAGGDSPLRVTAEAAPANLSFDGVARQFDGMQLEGATTLTVPSVAALAAWLGAPVDERLPVGSASISGILSWAAATLNFGAATVNLDGNVGEGALTATIVDGRPGIQATLDFARLDFTPFVDAVAAALDPSGAWRRAAVDLPIARSADVDLRLSAGKAIVVGTEIGPLAASLILKDGDILAEVGEAHFGPGDLDASIKASGVGGEIQAMGTLKGDGLSVEGVAGLLGLGGVTGVADATATFSTAGSTWGELASGLSGTVDLTLADGTVTGIDVTRIPDAVGVGGASPLGGSTAYSRIATGFTVAAGLVATDDFHAEGTGYSIDLGGKVVLAAPSIEARGVYTVSGEPPREVPFLVHGRWPAPEFLPDLGGPLPVDVDEPGPVPGNG